MCSSDLRPLHVLVAEDNPVNQRVAVRLLERRGYTVVVADDGRAAVERATLERFDLVLMDVQMPVMDGLEATRLLRAGGLTTLPIIAVTAHAMQGDRERCLDAGTDDYVSKPIRSESLYSAIDRVIAERDRRAA